MTETMPVILNYAFNTIGLHRIEGYVETENINCKKAHAKLKFNLEGTLVDCEVKNVGFNSAEVKDDFIIEIGSYNIRVLSVKYGDKEAFIEMIVNEKETK